MTSEHRGQVRAIAECDLLQHPVAARMGRFSLGSGVQRAWVASVCTMAFLLVCACEEKEVGNDTAWHEDGDKNGNGHLPEPVGPLAPNLQCRSDNFLLMIALQGTPDPPTSLCRASGGRARGLTGDSWCADVDDFSPTDWTGLAPAPGANLVIVDPDDPWFQALANSEKILAMIAKDYRPTQANPVFERVWKEAVFANAAQLVETLRRRGRVNMVRLFLSMELLVEAVVALKISDLARGQQLHQDYFDSWKMRVARWLTVVTEHLSSEVIKTLTQH